MKIYKFLGTEKDLVSKGFTMHRYYDGPQVFSRDGLIIFIGSEFYTADNDYSDYEFKTILFSNSDGINFQHLMNIEDILEFGKQPSYINYLEFQQAKEHFLAEYNEKVLKMFDQSEIQEIDYNDIWRF